MKWLRNLVPKISNAKRFCILFLNLALLVGSTVAIADGFSTRDDHDKLKGQVITEVGDVEKIEARSGYSSSMRNLFKIGGNCYESMGIPSLWGVGSKSGLVLINESKSISIAFLTSDINSIKVEVMPVLLTKCESASAESSSGASSANQIMEDAIKRNREMTKEILRRHEEDLRMLEQLRRQQRMAN